jgi:hypothetical protein
MAGSYTLAAPHFVPVALLSVAQFAEAYATYEKVLSPLPPRGGFHKFPGSWVARPVSLNQRAGPYARLSTDIYLSNLRVLALRLE